MPVPLLGMSHFIYGTKFHALGVRTSRLPREMKYAKCWFSCIKKSLSAERVELICFYLLKTGYMIFSFPFFLLHLDLWKIREEWNAWYGKKGRHFLWTEGECWSTSRIEETKYLDKWRMCVWQTRKVLKANAISKIEGRVSGGESKDTPVNENGAWDEGSEYPDRTGAKAVREEADDWQKGFHIPYLWKEIQNRTRHLINSTVLREGAGLLLLKWVAKRQKVRHSWICSRQPLFSVFVIWSNSSVGRHYKRYFSASRQDSCHFSSPQTLYWKGKGSGKWLEKPLTRMDLHQSICLDVVVEWMWNHSHPSVRIWGPVVGVELQYIGLGDLKRKPFKCMVKELFLLSETKTNERTHHFLLQSLGRGRGKRCRFKSRRKGHAFEGSKRFETYCGKKPIQVKCNYQGGIESREHTGFGIRRWWSERYEIFSSLQMICVAAGGTE